MAEVGGPYCDLNTILWRKKRKKIKEGQFLLKRDTWTKVLEKQNIVK